MAKTVVAKAKAKAEAPAAGDAIKKPKDSGVAKKAAEKPKAQAPKAEGKAEAKAGGLTRWPDAALPGEPPGGQQPS